jgi:hypothetical protein
LHISDLSNIYRAKGLAIVINVMVIVRMPSRIFLNLPGQGRYLSHPLR